MQTMKDLNVEDLEKFKRLLQSTQREKGLLRIPRHRLERAGRVEMVKLMMEAYDQSSVEVTRKVLKRMFWEDLQERRSKRPWRRFLSKSKNEFTKICKIVCSICMFYLQGLNMMNRMLNLSINVSLCDFLLRDINSV